MTDGPNYSLIKIHDRVFIRHQAKTFNVLVKEAMASGKSRFLVDMTSCEYISSEGLAAVAGLWHLCAEKSGAIVAIVCADDGANEVRYLLDIIGLARLMEGHLFSHVYDAEKFLAERQG